MSVRREFWFSEWDQIGNDPITGEEILIPGVDVTYWPPPTKRKKPDWADNLDDDVLRKLFDEIYQALNAGLGTLASIGIRTLLDRGMYLRVGDSQGGFARKLDLMEEQGHIGKNEKEIILAITVGNASAHRGFTPNDRILETILETAENFLQREFVLKTASGEVRTNTPKR